MILEWYDYTSLGGCVIPMWFMTSNWSYIEFSRHIPMYFYFRNKRDLTEIAKPNLAYSYSYFLV